MTVRNSLKTHMATGLAVFALQAAISFFLAPMLLRNLGENRYGAWSLIAELTGYYGLFDLGVRGAVVYFAATYQARGENDKLSQVLASAFWMLTGVAVVLLIAAFGLAAAWPRLFSSSEVPLSEIRPALILMSVVVAFTLPMDLFGALLVGSRHLSLANGLDMCTRVLNTIGIVLVLRSGGGLAPLAAVQLATKAMLWGGCVVVCRSLYGEAVSWHPRCFSWHALSNVFGYGGRNMVMNLARLIMNRTDLTLTGLLLGVRAVTGFQVGRMLIDYAFAAISSIAIPFSPHFTHHAARGEHEEATRLYLRGTRLTAVLTGIICTLGITFGSPFLRVWLGARFVEGPWLGRSDTVLWILLTAYAPRLVQHLSIQYLLALRRQRFLLWSSISEAAVKLVLCVVLGRWLGLAGIALSSLLPMLGLYGFLLSWYALPVFGIPFGRYWRDSLAGPCAATALAIPLCLLLPMWRAPHGWFWLIGEGVVGMLICTTLFTWLALKPEDRKQYLRLPG